MAFVTSMAPGLIERSWSSRTSCGLARLEGTISITGLPPHRGLIVNLCFFSVASADAPAPHHGDPPGEVVTDCDKVFEQVDLERESRETKFEHHFGVKRPGVAPGSAGLARLSMVIR